MSIWSGSSRTGNNPQIREKPKNGILSAGIYPYSGDIGGSFAFLRDFYEIFAKKPGRVFTNRKNCAIIRERKTYVIRRKDVRVHGLKSVPP